VRLFGLNPTSDHASVYTEEELRHLIDISRKSGHLNGEEQQLIQRVFDFSDAEVREAMVPRNQVKTISDKATLDEVRSAFLTSGYSRLPVYQDNLDNIIGLLFRKDLDMGRISEERFAVRTLVRPPVFIPATASLGDALKQMQAARGHFMFVIDEHGGLEGILTLEDLLEEIVGEINDEYDDEVREQIRHDGNTYILDGMLSVRDANRQLSLNLPEDESYTTIAGFLMAKAGRVLEASDHVEHDSGVFIVEHVDDRRITQVRFVPSTEAARGVAMTGSLLAIVVGSLTDSAVTIGSQLQ
jgi:CBS domain containing-hemolysin-like protein